SFGYCRSQVQILLPRPTKPQQTTAFCDAALLAARDKNRTNNGEIPGIESESPGKSPGIIFSVRPSFSTSPTETAGISPRVATQSTLNFPISVLQKQRPLQKANPAAANSISGDICASSSKTDARFVMATRQA